MDCLSYLIDHGANVNQANHDVCSMCVVFSKCLHDICFNNYFAYLVMFIGWQYSSNMCCQEWGQRLCIIFDRSWSQCESSKYECKQYSANILCVLLN